MMWLKSCWTKNVICSYSVIDFHQSLRLSVNLKTNSLRISYWLSTVKALVLSQIKNSWRFVWPFVIWEIIQCKAHFGSSRTMGLTLISPGSSMFRGSWSRIFFIVSVSHQDEIQGKRFLSSMFWWWFSIRFVVRFLIGTGLIRWSCQIQGGNGWQSMAMPIP